MQNKKLAHIKQFVDCLTQIEVKVQNKSMYSDG